MDRLTVEQPSSAGNTFRKFRIHLTSTLELLFSIKFFTDSEEASPAQEQKNVNQMHAFRQFCWMDLPYMRCFFLVSDLRLFKIHSIWQKLFLVFGVLDVGVFPWRLYKKNEGDIEKCRQEFVFEDVDNDDDDTKKCLNSWCVRQISDVKWYMNADKAVFCFFFGLSVCLHGLLIRMSVCLSACLLNRFKYPAVLLISIDFISICNFKWKIEEKKQAWSVSVKFYGVC